MLQKTILRLFIALIMLIVSVQNPIFASGLVIGQAYDIAPPDRGMIKNNHVPNQEESSLKKNISENQLSEAVMEKKSMPVISSSEIYQTIVEKEEQKQNKEIVQAIQKTDVTRLDLRKPSGLNGEQADRLLQGTGLEGLGKAFVSAEKTYHVNAYYLMAHAAWESGWGKSKISKEKNNLFGYMAYDHNPYGSAHGFANKSESINQVAKYVSENYLNENGDFYHGPHLSGMNVNYATDRNWKKGIASVMVVLAEKTEELNDSKAA